MMLEERMGKVCDILKAFRRDAAIGETLNRLESEIVKPAIEEEREACARIADAADKSTHPAEVADMIRARGEKG